MTNASATLSGHRVTDATVNIPAWGCWYADASLDGEVVLSGRVTLKVADLTLEGTVLSGGPAKGRSAYRLVAGAGGWGRAVARKPYVNDAGVKVATVLEDLASTVGETVAAVPSTERLGPAWTRQAAPACRVLELVAPGGWYVDEAGVTRLGARKAGELVGAVTRISPVDLARRSVVLAAESIASVLPGLVVDGITAIDVQHDISATGGLRSTVWGALNGESSRSLEGFRRLLEQLEPHRAFQGVTEYRVVTLEGDRLNLQPVRVSAGMPDLPLVAVWPGVSGGKTKPALGSRCLVAFIESDPARPYVCGFEGATSSVQPTELALLAGGMSGNEHVATVEAVSLLIYNTLVSLMAAAGGGPLIAAVLQPLIGTAITAALAAQATPAPPTAAAQAIAASAQLAGFATGVIPATTSAYFNSAIAALSTKTPNDSGLFPSLGAKAVVTG